MLYYVLDIVNICYKSLIYKKKKIAINIVDADLTYVGYTNDLCRKIYWALGFLCMFFNVN